MRTRVVQAALHGDIPIAAYAVLEYDEIAAPFGGSKVRVFRHLMSLVKAGFVTRDGAARS